MIYAEIFNEDGDQVECDCCMYPAPLGIFGEDYFCEICSSTHLNISIKYPDQCPDPNLYQAVAWIGNKILEELKKKGTKYLAIDKDAGGTSKHAYLHGTFWVRIRNQADRFDTKEEAINKATKWGAINPDIEEYHESRN